MTIKLFREDECQVPRLTSFEPREVTEFLIKFERYEKEIEESYNQVNDSVKLIGCVWMRI